MQKDVATTPHVSKMKNKSFKTEAQSLREFSIAPFLHQTIKVSREISTNISQIGRRSTLTSIDENEMAITPIGN